MHLSVFKDRELPHWLLGPFSYVGSDPGDDPLTLDVHNEHGCIWVPFLINRKCSIAKA